MQHQDSPPPPDQGPNKIVKIVFEQVDTDEPDIKGCRVYPEYDGRQLNLGIFTKDDRTIAECWAIEMLEFIRAQLLAKAHDVGGVAMEAPKKEDMN